MDRRLALLIAALSAAPMPALAQVWPAGAAVVAASARAPTPQVRSFTLVEPFAAARPEPQSTPPRILKLKARSALDADDPPPTDIRAKAEWSDDQGFRASPTRISYKLRF